MANYVLGQDIYNDVIARAPVLGGGDSVKRMVQQAYFDVLMYYPWSWLVKSPPKVIDIADAIEDTVTITKGLKAATITTDSAVTDLCATGKYYKLQHLVNQKVYRIVDHVDLVATLDATWKEDTIAAAEDVYIYQDEYDLDSSCWMPHSFFDRTNDNPLDFIRGKEMKDERLEEWYGTQVERVSVIADNKIRIKPWVLDGVTVEYEYAEEQDNLTINGVAGTDTPAIPLHDRHIIANMALLLVWQEWDDTPNLATKIHRIEGKVNAHLASMVDRDANWTHESNDLSA